MAAFINFSTLSVQSAVSSRITAFRPAFTCDVVTAHKRYQHNFRSARSGRTRGATMSSGSVSSTTTPPPSSSPKSSTALLTLYGSPVSNYTARCLYILYRKGMKEGGDFRFESPASMGGLKSAEYLKLNPLGKMPLLVPGGDTGIDPIFESNVICDYLIETLSHKAPAFVPETMAQRIKARTILSLVDIYMTPLHPCMYKKDIENRPEGVEKMMQIFDSIEFCIDETGPYLSGPTLSVADACLWGNFSFYDFMLPTFFKTSPTAGRPKLAKWRDFMATESKAAKQTYNQVFEALQGWWDNDRWVSLGMEAFTPRPTSTV